MILRHCWKQIINCRPSFSNFSIANRVVFVQQRLLSNVNHSDISQKQFILPTFIKNGTVKLPATKLSQIKSIYDRIPMMDLSLPCHRIVEAIREDVLCPPLVSNEVVQCKNGILKIRKQKMNKHKLKKRRKRDRAQIRKVLLGRARNRRKVRARRKQKLIEKIENIKERHAGSDYAERPYVIHRLKEW